jgi:hypothetical protein
VAIDGCLRRRGPYPKSCTSQACVDCAPRNDDVEVLIDRDNVGNDIQSGLPGKEGFQLLMDVGGD